MANKRRYGRTHVEPYIDKSNGVLSVVAKRSGLDRRTVERILSEHPDLRERLENERESMKDFAESKLFKQIDAENMTAIIFYLKTQAQDRGYIERQIVVGDVTTAKEFNDVCKRLGYDPAEVLKGLIAEMQRRAKTPV